MKNLLIAGMLSALTLTFAGCGKDAADELESWKNDACACKDKACAEKEAKAFWSLVKKFKDDKPSKDEAKKLDELADSGQECLKKLEVNVYDMAEG